LGWSSIVFEILHRTSMKYYIIAGEASGDLHASNLMYQLKLMDMSSSFRCWGGDLMQAQGCCFSEALSRFSIYGVYGSPHEHKNYTKQH
jgi:lipid A disaccharide synthetase